MLETFIVICCYVNTKTRQCPCTIVYHLQSCLPGGCFFSYGVIIGTEAKFGPIVCIIVDINFLRIGKIRI